MTLDSISEMNSDIDFMTSADKNIVCNEQEVKILDSRLAWKAMNQFPLTTSKGLKFSAIKLEQESSTEVTVEIGWDFKVGRG